VPSLTGVDAAPVASDPPASIGSAAWDEEQGRTVGPFAAMTAAMVLAAGAAGCSDTDESVVAEDDRERVVLDVAGAEPSEVTEAVRSWVDALGIADADVQPTDDVIEVRVPAEGASVVRAGFEDQPVVGFHPVRQLWPSGSEAPPEIPSDHTALEQVEGRDGLDYLVGSAAVTATGVESASVIDEPGEPVAVLLVLRDGPDGIDAFNDMAAECFVGAASCPSLSEVGRGLVAIVVDGTAVSAPSINVAEFERDQIQISGLEDDEARRLATALTAGPPPDGVTLR
jgi:preprotein translocase subunit SecD